MSPSALFDVKQLVEMYPVFNPGTIQKYCAQGKIPHVKVGRRVFFRVEDIEQWLADKVITRPDVERN